MALFNSFIFDSSKGETPQSIAMKRAIAAQIMGRSGNRSAKNVGEGLGNAFASIGDGIVANVMNRRATAGETEGRESADSLYKSITSGITGGLPMPGAAGEMAATSPDPSVSAMDISGGQQEFIDALLPAAIEESKRTGVDPRIIVAQAAQETGWGKSAPGNNFFGIKSHGKSGGQTLNTHEYVDGKRVNVADSFRTFESPADSVRGYGDFILNNPRYGALREAQGLDAQLAALQASGYATDPNYSRSVGAIARGIQLPEQQVSALTPEAAIEAIAPSSGMIAPPVAETPPAFDMGRFGDQINLAEMPPNAAQLPGSLIDQGASMPAAVRGDRLPYQPQAAPPLPDPINVGSLPTTPVQQPQNAPQQPVQVAQAGGQGYFPPQPDSPAQRPSGLESIPLQALMQAASNPFLNEGQRSVVNSILQQRLQAMDPYRQAQIAKMQREASGIGEAAKVQSSVVLDDGTSVMVMNNGDRRVLSPTGEEVSGQAAADAIRAAREYTVDNQRDIYSGRRAGTLGSDIEFGSAAEGAKELGKKSIEAGVSAWSDYGKLQSSIGNIDEALAAIDRGAQSGLVYNMLPSVTEASASLENAMNRMGLDVIGSVTFGALSEGEMRLAMDTAVPRGLQPEQLKVWLTRKREAQIKASAMLADAARFLTVPGNTINKWIEKNQAANGTAGAVPSGGHAVPDPTDGWQDMGGVKIRRKQ